MVSIQAQYDTLYRESPYCFGREPSWPIRLLAGFLNETSSVLDIGAGHGTQGLHLARATGCSVTAVDVSSVGLEQLVRDASGLRVSTIHGDISSQYVVGKLAQEYDAVLAINVLQFVGETHALRTIELMKDRVASGGYIGISATMEPDPQKRSKVKAEGMYTLGPGELQEHLPGYRYIFHQEVDHSMADGSRFWRARILAQKI